MQHLIKIQFNEPSALIVQCAQQGCEKKFSHDLVIQPPLYTFTVQFQTFAWRNKPTLIIETIHCFRVSYSHVYAEQY